MGVLPSGVWSWKGPPVLPSPNEVSPPDRPCRASIPWINSRGTAMHSLANHRECTEPREYTPGAGGASRPGGSEMVGRLISTALLVPAMCLAMSTAAMAQSAIAGQVKDATGAVLPGVTVEASSPALIERVRSVATDMQGRFNIVDLRPGSYKVTFSLPGFSMVTRDGIDLPANFTATVNAELAVGAVAETDRKSVV